MADPAKRPKPDKLGAVYLSQLVSERDANEKRRWRWIIEYDSAESAGVAPGESTVVSSVGTDASALFDSPEAAIDAAKAYAAKRAAADKAAAKAAADAEAAEAAADAEAAEAAGG